MTIRRRTVLASLAIAAPGVAFAAAKTPASMYYNAVGPTLAWWRPDIATVAGEPKSSSISKTLAGLEG